MAARRLALHRWKAWSFRTECAQSARHARAVASVAGRLSRVGRPRFRGRGLRRRRAEWFGNSRSRRFPNARRERQPSNRLRQRRARRLGRLVPRSGPWSFGCRHM